MFYRNDGVDIAKDTKDQLYISHIANDEWWQYSINVKQAGVYLLSASFATRSTGTKLAVSVNQQIEASSILPKTACDTCWQSVELGKVYLQQGSNQLKFKAVKGAFHWRSFSLQSAAQH